VFGTEEKVQSLKNVFKQRFALLNNIIIMTHIHV
jgi:hypothetical protein